MRLKVMSVCCIYKDTNPKIFVIQTTPFILFLSIFIFIVQVPFHQTFIPAFNRFLHRFFCAA